MNESIVEAPPEQLGEDKKKRKKWPIVVAVLVLLILATLGILYMLGYLGGDAQALDNGGILIGSGVNEIEGTGGDEDGANGTATISINLNARPVFHDGESEGNLNIINSKKNLLYMLVEITLNDTGEVIYESGGIPPGYYIGNDKLSKVLAKGEYEATAHVTLLNADDSNAQYNSMNFDLVITVEN